MINFRIITAVLFLTAAAAFSQKASPEEEQALADFTKYMAVKDTATRINQIDSVAKFDSPLFARVLIDLGLTDESSQVRTRAMRALSGHRDPKSIELLIGAVKDKSPTIREGAVQALSRIGEKDGLDAIAAQLAAEKEPSVIAAILNTLSQAKRNVAAAEASKHLRSPHPVVVFAAIDMLGNTAEPKNAESLNPLLRSREWAVQTAVLQALSKLRSKTSIPFLIEALAAAKEQGRIAAECRDTLVKITGWEWGLDADKWKGWWAKCDPAWEVPKEIKKVDTAAEGYGRRPTGYHTIKTESRKIFFVVDISCSMDQSIRFKDEQGNWRTERRMDMAKTELIRTLKTLDENTEFGLLAFESLLKPYKDGLVRGTKGNIEDAIRWVESTNPPQQGSGSVAKTDEGYKRGETNTYAAIKWIFGRKGPGTAGSAAGTTGNGSGGSKYKPISDTVFFLSDGDPSCGEITVHDDIIEEVKRMNQTSKVVIHTIAFDLVGIGRKFLADVAAATGGTSVVLGEANR